MKIVFVLFSLILLQSSSKIVERSVYPSIFTNRTRAILAQFITGSEGGNFSLTIWNDIRRQADPQKGNLELDFKLLTLEEFENAKSSNCLDSIPSNATTKLKVPFKGNKVSLPNQSLGPNKIWVFVLEECHGVYFTEHFNGNTIVIELEIRNSGNSHFSEEENGVLSVVFWLLIPLTGFLIFQAKKVMDFYSQKTAIDYPVLMLTFALFLEFLALGGEYLHLYVYSKNGEGVFLLDWTNFLLTHLSQFTISTLFVLMSGGWTVKPLQKKDKDMFLAFAIMTSIMVCAMAVSSKDSQDVLESYHDYQTMPGRVLLVFKFLMYYLFLHQLRPNYKESDSPKLQKHYKSLGVFGSLYLLSLPLAVLIADLLLPVVYQHKMIMISSILIQSSTLLLYIFYLSSSKENESYPIYYKNNRFVSAAKMI